MGKDSHVFSIFVFYHIISPSNKPPPCHLTLPTPLHPPPPLHPLPRLRQFFVAKISLPKCPARRKRSACWESIRGLCRRRRRFWGRGWERRGCSGWWGGTWWLRCAGRNCGLGFLIGLDSCRLWLWADVKKEREVEVAAGDYIRGEVAKIWCAICWVW